MQITPTVDIPWHTIAIDLHGPITNTEQYPLVVTDLYSKFQEIEILNSTTAPAVIPKLDRIFATHGIPVKLKTDNGPPFNGNEFKRYTKALGMEWKPSTPLWLQGNSNVESLTKAIGKVLQTAKLEGKNWKQELQRFLLTYQTTLHDTTKVPPCELLFNRSIRGQLHELPRKRVLNKHKKAKENIEKKKAQNKEYYGKKHNTKESEIKVGDTVICLQKRTNKLVPKFSPERFIVQERKGTKILVKNRRHIITRNVSHFKRVPATDSYNNEEEDISDSDSKKEKKEQEKIEVDDRPRRSKRSKIPVWRFGFMQM
ncbi:protein NYNRIN-like [Rhopilema esculentum]|uniref:protein NYNRIN-like n=1 Tax=Rhopilema esculentum TaxID=499914 RepID=UPI0031D47789